MSSGTHRWTLRPVRPRFLLVLFLVLTNITTGILLIRFWWENRLAEDSAFGFAAYAGAMQAHADYRNGVLRQYELIADSHTGFTGQRDGPFEVWGWNFYPSLGRIDRIANEAFVEVYDKKMKFMQQHPEQFQPDETGAHKTNGEP